jgi:hypothetical protein
MSEYYRLRPSAVVKTFDICKVRNGRMLVVVGAQGTAVVALCVIPASRNCATSLHAAPSTLAMIF